LKNDKEFDNLLRACRALRAALDAHDMPEFWRAIARILQALKELEKND
jgi:hypothetical protein